MSPTARRGLLKTGLAFTIIALAAAGMVKVDKAESDAPMANSWLRAPVPAAAGLSWYGSQPANPPSRWLRALPTQGESLPALILPIQFRDPKNLGAGKLLVASRGLGDPNFAQTVIQLVHYDEKGVIGLVLNRRTDVPLSRVLDLEAARDRSDPVYLGGPVEPRPLLPCFRPRPRWKRLKTSSVECI
jgi:hypothetical protein